MPEGNTSGPRSARNMVLEGATLREVDFWMDHHLSGNWFTSNLLRLMSQADRENRKRLSYVFPDEHTIWSYWQARMELPAMSMSPTGALTGSE